MVLALKFVTALLFCAFFVGVSFGRIVPEWPYTKLVEESDLVVIATHVVTKNDDAVSRIDLGKSAELKGVATEFSVKCALKGKAVGSVIVSHFRLAMTAEGSVEDAPATVEFPGKPENHRSAKPREYLLFLRKTGDAKYVFTTGSWDPHLSLRTIGDGPRAK